MSNVAAASAVPSLVADPQRLAALESFGILDTAPDESFDEIVQVAVLLCETPVGLVSLVAGDRQWFKARIGFPSCETDLNSSVCAHALAEPDLLVIPDLAADPRTDSNPLVTGEPHVRFYAGAPLRTKTGQPLGSLCVIDHRPRPGGLTPKQAEGLRALAQQTCVQLELRRALHERAAMEAKLVASEARWRGLFERLREGLVIGQVIRDAEGRITDWRYLDVNQAWTELTGFAAADAVGRTLREVLPQVEDEWISEPGYVVDTGEAATFTRQVGVLNKWYEGRVSALTEDTFIILFLDVTDRILAEQAIAASSRRRVALARLADLLRTAMDADAMGYTAGAVIGPALGATQAGYAAIDAAKETVDIGPTWAVPGTPSLSGHHDFRSYGSYIDDLKAGRAVNVKDVRTDRRTSSGAEALLALGVVALINMPVIEQGSLVAVLFVVFNSPRDLTKEDEDFVRAAADRARAGIARIRAEEQQAILNNEISHRLKNSMAMVQAIAGQTLKKVSDREAVTAFEQRLMALSTAHDVLLQTDWEAANLDEVLVRVLDTAGANGRYDAAGPAVKLGARAALSTSLLLHELATNASKYGALTNASGKVEVRWHFERTTAAEELVLDWREIGGPPAIEPTRKGFGSRLLRMGLIGTGGSQIGYRESGLEATFRATRKQVEQAG